MIKFLSPILAQDPVGYKMIGAVFAVVVLVGLSCLFLPAEIMLGETGVVERSSVALYALVIPVVVIWRMRYKLPPIWSGAFLMALFAMREMDFDKRFTSMGLLKLKLYTRDIAPMHERIIGAVLIISMILIIGALFYFHFKPFLKNLKRFKPAALGVFFAFGFLGTAKVLDGIQRKAADFGFEVSEIILTGALMIEETFELGAPLMLLVAALIPILRVRRARDEGVGASQG